MGSVLIDINASEKSSDVWYFYFSLLIRIYQSPVNSNFGHWTSNYLISVEPSLPERCSILFKCWFPRSLLVYLKRFRNSIGYFNLKVQKLGLDKSLLLKAWDTLFGRSRCFTVVSQISLDGKALKAWVPNMTIRYISYSALFLLLQINDPRKCMRYFGNGPLLNLVNWEICFAMLCHILTSPAPFIELRLASFVVVRSSGSAWSFD